MDATSSGSRRKPLTSRRSSRNWLSSRLPKRSRSNRWNIPYRGIYKNPQDGPWVQKPTGKGERLIIIHAMTKNGWIPGAQLTFKSTKKTGDYHGQMHHGLFTKWLSEQLLPTMPENALIIMDNASYHHALSHHSAPTAT